MQHIITFKITTKLLLHTNVIFCHLLNNSEDIKFLPTDTTHLLARVNISYLKLKINTIALSKFMLRLAIQSTESTISNVTIKSIDFREPASNKNKVCLG